MDWQSSRGSRRNRIQKEPGGRSPLASVAMVLILMIGAVVLGYLISQALLPAFLGGNTTARTSTSSAVVSSAASPPSSSAVSSAISSAPSESVPPEPSSVPVASSSSAIATGAPFTAQLPEISYYQVQVTTGPSQDAAERVMTALHEESYVAAVIPKGEFYSVQVGMFGVRDQAQNFVATMINLGYTGAWVTDWKIALNNPLQFTGDQAAIRESQATAVLKLAEAIAAIMDGSIPDMPSDLALPEGASAEDQELWETAVDDVQTWINDASARRSGLLAEIVSNLKDIYQWFE